MILYRNGSSYKVSKVYKKDGGQYKIGRITREEYECFIITKELAKIYEYILNKMYINFDFGRGRNRSDEFHNFLNMMTEEYGVNFIEHSGVFYKWWSVGGIEEIIPSVSTINGEYKLVEIFGYGVLVDKEWNILDPEKELFQPLEPGDIVEGPISFTHKDATRLLMYDQETGSVNFRYYYESVDRYTCIKKFTPCNVYKKIGHVNISRKLSDIISDTKDYLIETRKEIFEIDNITIKNNEVIYITKDRMAGRDKLKPSLYTHLKIGRFINSFFRVGDATNLSIQEGFDFYTCIDFKYDIVSGKKITEVYMNGATMGTIGSSCMRHERCMNYFGIYEDNAEMITRKDSNGKYAVRALLWTLTHKTTGEKIKMVDRIYVANHREIQRVKAFARKNGWLYLNDQTFGQTTAIKGDEQVSLKDYYIELNKSEYKHYPFLDTFSYLIESKLYVALDNVKKLRSTKGGYDAY